MEDDDRASCEKNAAYDYHVGDMSVQCISLLLEIDWILFCTPPHPQVAEREKEDVIRYLNYCVQSPWPADADQSVIFARMRKLLMATPSSPPSV